MKSAARRESNPHHGLVRPSRTLSAWAFFPLLDDVRHGGILP